MYYRSCNVFYFNPLIYKNYCYVNFTWKYQLSLIYLCINILYMDI